MLQVPQLLSHLFRRPYVTREQNLSFIVILEIERSTFSYPFLKNLCAEKIFLWHCKELKGRSSGILIGIDLDVSDIGAIDEGDYYVKFHLCNKDNYFEGPNKTIRGGVNGSQLKFYTRELGLCPKVNLMCLSSNSIKIT
jgi:hypothetical protein